MATEIQQARRPPLWDLSDAARDGFDPNAQPVLAYDFSQRLSWSLAPSPSLCTTPGRLAPAPAGLAALVSAPARKFHRRRAKQPVAIASRRPVALPKKLSETDA